MNFKENRPIYLQIADRLTDEILRRAYGEGERIPSVREYAAEVEVNANTVVRSYDFLQQNGVIFNRRGLGYFVSEGARRTILELRRKAFIDDDLPELFRKMRLIGVGMDEISEEYTKFLEREKR